MLTGIGSPCERPYVIRALTIFIYAHLNFACTELVRKYILL